MNCQDPLLDFPAPLMEEAAKDRLETLLVRDESEPLKTERIIL
jgi:hypothetical protein